MLKAVLDGGTDELGLERETIEGGSAEASVWLPDHVCTDIDVAQFCNDDIGHFAVDVHVVNAFHHRVVLFVVDGSIDLLVIVPGGQRRCV